MRTFEQLADRLQEYAEIDGSELAELFTRLLELSHYHHMCTDEFAVALRKEMEGQVDWMDSHYDIVETEREVRRTITERELVEK